MRTYSTIFIIIISTFVGQALYAQNIKDLFKKEIEDKKKEGIEKAKQEKEKEELAKQQAKEDSITLAEELLKDPEEIEDDVAEMLEEQNKVAYKVDTVKFKQRSRNAKVIHKPGRDISNEEETFKYLIHNSFKDKYVLDEKAIVFGWHPYWMGNAYKAYNFDLLSHVAYFSYEVIPQTGEYKSIHNWTKKAMVDSAKAHGCKALLSVTNFGETNNKIFLSNKSAQATLIKNLVSLINLRNADGVNLDFENVPRSHKREFTNFIIALSSELRSANVDKQYTISIAVPAIDFRDVYEISALKPHIDIFIIMGYEFHGSNSKFAGPVSPLFSGSTWWEFNLQKSVDGYLLNEVPPEKLVLGLPYYGSEWQTEDLKFPSRVKRFIRHPMYRDILNTHNSVGCCVDEISKSKFYVYRKGVQYRQIWYEDSVSLATKYDWIKEKKLAGIGIWALGYDHGYHELWRLIGRKFATPYEEFLAGDSTAAAAKSKPKVRLGFFRRMARIIQNPAILLKNPRPLAGMLGGLFGVSLIGFFVLWRYGHKFKRIFKVFLQSTVALCVLVIIGLLFVVTSYTQFNEFGYLILGFIIALILFFLIGRRFLTEKDYP